MTRDHPWRRFRALADWSLHWAKLPGDLMAYVDWSHRRVTLDNRLLQAERRCSIAHELEHIRRGPPPLSPALAAREEESIDRAVARRLIPIRDMAEALAWTLDLDEAAEELWVDRATLEARLRSLHPSERAYLKQRLEHHEHV